MKIRRICSFVVLCIVAVCACFVSGCAYLEIKEVQGVYEMVKKDDGSAVSYAFTSAEVMIDRYNARFSFSYSEFCDAEEMEKFELKSGNYSIASYNDHGDGVDFYIVLSETAEGWYHGPRVEVNDGRLVLYAIGVCFKQDVGEYEAGKTYYCEMEFQKTGKDVEKPPVDNKFAAVKESYIRAGYDTDLNSDKVDPDIAEAISTMRETYKQFGYTMDFIGKGLTDLTGAELYMLIDAGSTEKAKEFASALGGTYKNAQSGSCVIVFILGTGEPNFTPFNQA